VIEFVISLVRQKLKFVVFLAAVAIIGVFATNGLSWTSVLVTAIAVFVVLFGWALVSFWIWVFRNAGRGVSQ